MNEKVNEKKQETRLRAMGSIQVGNAGSAGKAGMPALCFPVRSTGGVPSGTPCGVVMAYSKRSSRVGRDLITRFLSRDVVRYPREEVVAFHRALPDRDSE
jgi:hypothetical protein